jgi:hypothetical protein
VASSRVIATLVDMMLHGAKIWYFFENYLAFCTVTGYFIVYYRYFGAAG